MKIGTRNLDTRPTEIPTQVLTHWDGTNVTPPGTNPNQKWEWKDVPYEQHMTPICLPIFKLPGIMRNLSPEQAWRDHLVGPWMHFEHFLDPGFPMWIDTPIDHNLIARMVAKIAHGMAVWSYGADGFRPFLQEIIRGTDISKLFYFVGGWPNPPPPTPVTIFPHRLEIAIGNIIGQEQVFVFAIVRLFADRFIRGRPELGGTPIYTVVVGEKI